MIAADRLLPEEDAALGREALHQVLGSLGDEIPAKVRKTDQRWKSGGSWSGSRQIRTVQAILHRDFFRWCRTLQAISI